MGVSLRVSLLFPIFCRRNPIQERCTIVLRIAPTFLRFGSFEIFKTTARARP